MKSFLLMTVLLLTIMAAFFMFAADIQTITPNATIDVSGVGADSVSQLEEQAVAQQAVAQLYAEKALVARKTAEAEMISATRQAEIATQQVQNQIMMMTADAQKLIEDRAFNAQSTQQAVEFSATQSAIHAVETENAQQVALLAAEATRLVNATASAEAVVAQSTQQQNAMIADEATRSVQSTADAQAIAATVWAEQLNAQKRSESMMTNGLIGVGILAIVLIAICSLLAYVYIQQQKPVQTIMVDQRRIVVARTADGGFLPITEEQTLLAAQPVIQQIVPPQPQRRRPVRANQQRPSLDFLKRAKSADVVSYLDTAKCILLVGAQDTGKTTFALHLTNRREKLLIIDPKPRTAWPQHAQVKGVGYGWDEISGTLNATVDEMTNRYRKMRDDHSYEPTELHILIDEWPSIVSMLPDAADAIKRLVFEGREAGIRVIIITQSDDVTTLGIQGQGKLREAFTVVYLSKNATGSRMARIVWGDTEKSFKHPGPFGPPTQAPLPFADADNLSWLDDMRTVEGADVYSEGQPIPGTAAYERMEPRILSHYNQSRSLAELERLAYNLPEDAAVGGNRYHMIIRVLDNNGLARPQRDRAHAMPVIEGEIVN